ncbi:transporter substrate-binding domain-containing protein [Paraburkholderia sp. CNPSo 3076]|uniref:transporter substrate-binding domain-containing protein n=1 Tax=Paraburkholderia sp. CNPSo 3076 TaxID=2940936 RepID=UPI00224D9D90|nr:transporter substrate-binding domain-containing protein [Paraburkholderia sp. CNPSo 3076]MCX5541304.1 transporter substrate-binding domain-containing protein [Paraburkholderia sp. CNPSo 3076]
MASNAPLDASAVPRRLRWPATTLTATLALVALLALLAWVLNGDLPRTLPESDRPFAAAAARGVLIVAVPPRPAPTLYVGKVDRTARSPDPFAAALASDLARRAGLPVQFLLVEPAAARAALQSGKADAAIAGLGFSPDARVAFAPASYSSGRGMALVLGHGTVRTWRDLRGRAICASQGNPYAQRAAREYHANMHGFDRPLDALLAFQAGDCAALVDDEFVIEALLKQADWSYYRPLPGTIAAQAAFIATRAGDAASAVFVGDTLTAWRRSRWLATVRKDQAINLAFDMFNAENDLYCH